MGTDFSALKIWCILIIQKIFVEKKNKCISGTASPVEISRCEWQELQEKAVLAQ